MKSPKDQETLFPKSTYILDKDANQLDASLLTSLIHSLPINVYAKDKNGVFIFANAFYCKSVGKERLEIIGKNDFEIHPQELAQKYLADDKRIMLNRQTESIEEKWRSLGGKLNYIHVIKSPLYDNHLQKEVIGTIGMFWDITERKRAEISLAEERNLLRTLIDNLPDYIYVKDLQSRFVLANKAVTQLMGEENPDKLIGQTDFDYYSKEDALQFHQVEQQILENGKSQTDIEESFDNRQGEKEWILTSKLPLRNIDGDCVGIVGMGHNITERKRQEAERKRLEAQLLHSQKMETVGTLTAGIAHDFNNLLNIINGYTELLMLKSGKEDKDYTQLNRILQAGRSAAMLVNQLMMFSRKGVLQPKVIDFNSLLINIQHMLRRIIGEEIDMRQNLADDLYHIKIDPAQMEQVIVNLVANARDAMPQGGVLQLVTKNITKTAKSEHLPAALKDGDYICFLVTDNGFGIKKNHQQHIFEPFYTTKEKDKGTGLGLATVFGIIEQNGGSIDLISEEGKGATFRIFLPRTDGTISATEPLPEEVESKGGSETILVVEDQEDVKKLVMDVLNEKGYSVLGAHDGFEAVRLTEEIGSTRIDLLITDVVMPGMSGKTLAEKLRSSDPDLKILFMSGYSGDAINQFDLAQSGLEYIQKPFKSSDIVNKVRVLLDSSGDK